jgi:hypothetical protein
MPELNEAASPLGNQSPAEALPELYGELRRVGTALTARLPPGQTLQTSTNVLLADPSALIPQ